MKNNLVPPNMVPMLEKNLTAYEYRMLTETTLASPKENIFEMLRILTNMLGIPQQNQTIEPPQPAFMPNMSGFNPDPVMIPYEPVDHYTQTTNNGGGLSQADLINMFNGTGG